jgi:hypothetical protein
MHHPSLYCAARIDMRLSSAPRFPLMRYLMPTQALDRPPFSVLKRNWPLYVYEATELALFMLSACAFTIFLFDPSWPASRLFPSAIVRRALMAIAMGITAVLIIHSPMGKRSGAHSGHYPHLSSSWQDWFMQCRLLCTIPIFRWGPWSGCRSSYFW